MWSGSLQFGTVDSFPQNQSLECPTIQFRRPHDHTLLNFKRASRPHSNQKEMVITSNGRPIAILSSINENNLEQVLSAFRRARATNAVSSIQYDSVRQGTDKITMDEIEDEIKAVRSKRQK
jgi:hypothetical protein